MTEKEDYAAFEAWKRSQEAKAEADTGKRQARREGEKQDGEAASFASDTSERDKGRTDLPWSPQTDSESVEGTNPSPEPSTALESAPVAPAVAASGTVEDAVARIESMVTDIHRVFSDAQPVVTEAAETLKNEGIGGLLKGMMGLGR